MNTTLKKERRVMVPEERQGLTQRLGEHKFERTETNSNYPVNQEVTLQERKIQGALKKDDESKDVTKTEKDMAPDLIKKLEDWIRPKLTPFKDLARRRGKDGMLDSETQRVINEHIRTEMSAEVQGKIRELKYWLRIVGRDSNLDYLRPES